MKKKIIRYNIIYYNNVYNQHLKYSVLIQRPKGAFQKWGSRKWAEYLYRKSAEKLNSIRYVIFVRKSKLILIKMDCINDMII